MLSIEEIKDKKIWDDFLEKETKHYPLFQSWDWGEVQTKLGKNIFKYGLFGNPDKLSDKKLLGVFLIVDIEARRGHYLHLRHGPVLSSLNQNFFDLIMSFVKKIAREKHASFMRISPLIKKDGIYENFLKKRGFINAPIHNMDAETCWVLNLEKPEEELLKGMRKTHRYLIKKARNMNIKIFRGNNLSDIDDFISLYKDLSLRKGFIPHVGIREEFEVLSKNNEALLLLARYDGKIISGALIILIGNTAIYHHGVLSEEYKNIPASYLIQWEAIKEAKKRGKKIYNFWGIVPVDQPNHPWKGITLFKTGFGGERWDFIHAKDFPLNLWYWKSYLIEYITKIKKGY